MEPLLWHAAAVWRRLLVRTTFVAITGSVGKTTAKELTAAALASLGRVHRTRGTANSGALIPLTVLRTRPWHRVAVVEVAGASPGRIARATRVLRPHVAVVLTVARTHTDAFATLDDTAAEKASLLAGVPPGGVAILNADDPHVAAMAPPAGVTARRFGTAPGCDVRVADLASAWPERLSLTAERGGETVTCRTRLVGTHWWPSVAAALAVATECGVPLAAAARALATVPPTTGRLSPVAAPSGATLLRDDYNGSVDTLAAALAVLRDARARRRVLLLSDYSDLGQSFRGRFRLLPDLLRDCCDEVVLLGEHAAYGRRRLLEAGLPAEAVGTVATLREATAQLGARYGAGDLLLLRGRSSDHLARLAVAQFGDVGCWRADCRLTTLCDECPWLGADRATLAAAARDPGAPSGPVSSGRAAPPAASG